MTTFADLEARGSLLLNDGYRTKAAELGEPGFPVLRVAEVGEGNVTPSFRDHVRAEFRAKIGYKLSSPGDVLLTTKGTVGRRAIMPALAAEFAYSPQLCFFRVLDNSIHSRWLYYWLGSDAFWSQATSVSQQTDMAPYISLRDLRSIKVTLPPIEEQRAIAATLGAFDDKIGSNRRLVHVSRTLMDAIWDASKKVRVVASTVIKPVLGGTPKRSVDEYWSGNISWASAKDVVASKGGYILHTAESITQAGVDNSAAKVLPAGTVVMTARGTVGALAQLAEPMAFNQSCYGLTSDFVSPATLMVALGAAVARIQEAGHGTVFNTVNMATFDQIELDLPEDRAVDEKLGQLANLVLNRLQESRRLAQLRDALLPELLSGRIRVREAVT